MEHIAWLGGSLHGFTLSSNCTWIYCPFGIAHDKALNWREITNVPFYGDDTDKPNTKSVKKERRRKALSTIGCMFRIHHTHTIPCGNELTRAIKTVKILSIHFKHKHPLNKSSINHVKQAIKQYLIPLDACLAMLKLMKDGPLCDNHTWNFGKRYHPVSQLITIQIYSTSRSIAKTTKNKMGQWAKFLSMK